MSTIQGYGCQGSRAATIEDTFHWDGPVCWSPIQLPARVTFWPSPAPKDDGTTHSRSGPAPFKGAHKTRLGNKRQWQRQKTKTKTTAHSRVHTKLSKKTMPCWMLRVRWRKARFVKYFIQTDIDHRCLLNWPRLKNCHTNQFPTIHWWYYLTMAALPFFSFPWSV